MRRRLPIVGLAAMVVAAPLAAAPLPAGPNEDTASIAALPGWREDDQAAAFRAFLRTCRSAGHGLRPACGAADRRPGLGGADARRFFERWFDPVPVARPGRPDGFLTGYYEPEFAAAAAPDAAFPTPLLARPPGLVVIERGARPAGWPEGQTAAWRTGSGFAPLPDRAAIETGALDGKACPIAYLDPVDAFMVHVQGSARLKLADGRVIRVGFDGRNGYPYTAIARVVAEREDLPPAGMTADRLIAWLRAHPDEAPGIMRRNRSYIFFRRMPGSPSVDGPVGAAGIALTPGRSLAVDRSATPFGLPVWLEGELPVPGGTATPLRRLVVAQDAGAAIVGPARGDLFFGSGPAAGAAASLVRNLVRWVELRPRARPRRAGP